MSKKDRQHQTIPGKAQQAEALPLSDADVAAALSPPVARDPEIARLKEDLESRERHVRDLTGLVERSNATITELTERLSATERLVRDDTSLANALRKRMIEHGGDGVTDAQVLERLDAMLGALPVTGWSSQRARELVEAVEAQSGLRASDVRALLLGDLLVQLAPHVGETGQNETATDALGRIIKQRQQNIARYEALVAECQQERERANTLEAAHAKLQASMVARRAPDAAAGVALEKIRGLLGSGPGLEDRLVSDLEKILAERNGLRDFLSGAPLVAVAVRDDSTKDVRERYTVLLLEWDGKQVAVSAFDERLPWADVQPRMRQLVDTRLVPESYR